MNNKTIEEIALALHNEGSHNHRKAKTSLPYKLGGLSDPHFQHEAEELSRTEATCDWYDERNRDLEYESRVDYESNYIDQNP